MPASANPTPSFSVTSPGATPGSLRVDVGEIGKDDQGRAFVLTGSRPEVSRPETGPEPVTSFTALAHAANVATAREMNASWLGSARSTAWGPPGFLWMLPGQLAGTPLPGVVHSVRHDLEALRSAGVNCLISLTETPFDPVLAGEFGMTCLASPMPDRAAPTLAQAVFLCQFIDQALAHSQVVAVQGHAGLGRTGTVLAAYWLWRHGGRVSAPQALEQVRRMAPGWVQSQVQIQFLEEFAQVVAGADDTVTVQADAPTNLSEIAASIFQNRLRSQTGITQASL